VQTKISGGYAGTDCRLCTLYKGSKQTLSEFLPLFLQNREWDSGQSPENINKKKLFCTLFTEELFQKVVGSDNARLSLSGLCKSRVMTTHAVKPLFRSHQDHTYMHTLRYIRAIAKSFCGTLSHTLQRAFAL
jgi:hypothetical protein